MEKGIWKPTSPKEYSKAENGCIKKKTGEKNFNDIYSPRAVVLLQKEAE